MVNSSRRSAAQRQQLLANLDRSGLSAAAFARQSRIGLSTLFRRFVRANATFEITDWFHRHIRVSVLTRPDAAKR